MYKRSGHCDEIFVKVGDKVKKGDKVATVGDGNGLYKGASHEHADFPIKKLTLWTDYVFGMTKEQVRNLYADPKMYRPKWYDHMGWGFLEYATYGAKKCFHPGEDWNGKGAGDSDKKLPIFAPFDGEVVYCYRGSGTNLGWGKLLVIKEIKNEPVSASKLPEPQLTTEPVNTPQIAEITPIKTSDEVLVDSIGVYNADMPEDRELVYATPQKTLEEIQQQIVNFVQSELKKPNLLDIIKSLIEKLWHK